MLVKIIIKIFRLPCIRIICLTLFIITGGASTAIAQNTSAEFWPESDIWYTLGSSWRLSSFIAITKYNESKYRDLNIYLQADYGWGRTKSILYRRLMDENKVQETKGWMTRGGFMKGWSLGENAGNYEEDLLFAEIHKRVPLKGGLLLSQRFRTDFRWVGPDTKFSYRFRYRIMIEKDFTVGRSSIVPYVNAEPYWDSRYSEFNRIRLIGGATLARGERLAYETNITYQHDLHYTTANVYALNIILHVFFERTKHKKNTVSYIKQ